MADAARIARSTSTPSTLPPPAFVAPSAPSIPPPPPTLHPLLSAALACTQGAARPQRLDDLWQEHLGGRLFCFTEIEEDGSTLLISRVVPSIDPADTPDDASNVRPPAHDRALAARVLTGEPQKSLAIEFRVAPSTLSTRHVRVLKHMGLKPKEVPLTLILAAQAWIGVEGMPSAYRSFFEYQGTTYVVVRTPVPSTRPLRSLTPALRAVASLILAGQTRTQIAERRGTSINTVARQFHAIFTQEKVTGRFALVRRAAEQHCFG